MIQNLFNSINNLQNIQEKASTAAANFSADDSKVDFQKLFDKQNALGGKSGKSDKTEKSSDTNTIASGLKNEKDSSKEADNDTSLQPNETFAGSVIYDIRELIAYLASQGQKDENTESSDSEDTTSSISETEATASTGEELDAEEIAKKILHIEDEEDEDEKDKATNNIDSKTETDEMKEITEITETAQAITLPETESSKEVMQNFEEIETLLETAEAVSDEVQIATEGQTKVKETISKTDEAIEDILNEEQIKELNIESIDAESGSDDTQSDLMHHESAEEHSVKVMLQGDVDYSDVQFNTNQSTNTQTVKPNNQVLEANPNKILEQITKQMESMQSGSRVNIVLNPESLGKVSVQLINTPEGLSAQFTVTTQEARNLIMKGLDGLKDNLISHGVSVDNVSVKLNDTQESEYNADWTEQEGSRGGNKEQHSNRGQKDKQEFEQTMAFAQNEEV